MADLAIGQIRKVTETQHPILFEPEFHAEHLLRKDYGSKIDRKQVICKNP